MSSSNQSTVPPRGGVSTIPTPANNMAAGSVSRHQLHTKESGVGHQSEAKHMNTNPVKFTSLESERTSEEMKAQARYAAASDESPMALKEPTCHTEDHSFQYQKPGYTSAWDKTKDLAKSAAGFE